MQINSFIIAGRLTKPVEYGATTNGIPAATFVIANNRGKHTNFFKVNAYNSTADYAKDYLHKSQRITVQGRMQHNTTEANGTYHNYYTVIADTFDAIHPKQTQSGDVKKLYARVDQLDKKINKASEPTKKAAHKHRKK